MVNNSQNITTGDLTEKLQELFIDIKALIDSVQQKLDNLETRIINIETKTINNVNTASVIMLNKLKSIEDKIDTK
jgi:hypothetical protein